MMSFQNARGSENSAQAEAILEELHVMHEQGKLSTYESYIMFLFYGGRASEQERYAEAIAYYDQGLALTALGNPQKKQLYMAKAQAYRPMDELPQAINSFLQAHELSEEPDYSVLKGLMYSYYQLDDYPQALRYAEQFLEEKYDLANQGDYQMISGLYRSVGNDTRADALDREAEQRLQEPGFIAVELEERDLMPLTTVPPVYPASALAQKIEGWVHVGFTVDTNGEVLDPHVIDQDPERVFEQAALDAIVRFKFREKAAGSNRQYVFTFRTDN